jgi:hypothetical protein
MLQRTHLRPRYGAAFVFDPCLEWKLSLEGDLERPRLGPKASSAPRPLIELGYAAQHPNRPLTTFIEQRQRPARQRICHYRELRRMHIYM